MSAAHDLLQSLLPSQAPTSDTPAPAPLRALAWARVSTDMQGERGASIPEQLREIRAHAERHGVEIVEAFQEVASAFQKEERRVEFRRMLERAKSDSSVNAILVHDFSRFSRDNVQAQVHIRELREAGVRVLSV